MEQNFVLQPHWLQQKETGHQPQHKETDLLHDGSIIELSASSATCTWWLLLADQHLAFI